MRDARLAIDSNAASVWWVNAKEVGGNCDRQTVIDDGVSKRITLNAGPSIVRVGVNQQRWYYRILCPVPRSERQTVERVHSERG
jgi:hypothetical protein